MQENKNRIVWMILIGALLVGNVYFGLNYFFQAKELGELSSSAEKSETNTKVLEFTSMFVKKVLQADQEVDFETRLALENAVRGLEDEEVMSLWQNFVGSKTEREAQNNVKELLGVLISKIQE